MGGCALPPLRSPGGQRPAWSKFVPAPPSPSQGRGPRSPAGQHLSPSLSSPRAGEVVMETDALSLPRSMRISDRGCVGPGTGMPFASRQGESLHWGLKNQPTTDPEP